MPVARQIKVTIARGKQRVFVADEKIRLAQFALQDALDEKGREVRECPSAERLKEEVVPGRQTPTGTIFGQQSCSSCERR